MSTSIVKFEPEVGNRFPPPTEWTDASRMDADALAVFVADRAVALAVFSEALKPYYEELRSRFSTKLHSKEIHGCCTWDEYCTKVLDRTKRAVNYWLAGGNPVAKRKPKKPSRKELMHTLTTVRAVNAGQEREIAQARKEGKQEAYRETAIKALAEGVISDDDHDEVLKAVAAADVEETYYVIRRKSDGAFWTGCSFVQFDGNCLKFRLAKDYDTILDSEFDHKDRSSALHADKKHFNSLTKWDSKVKFDPTNYEWVSVEAVYTLTPVEKP
jgi:hypothetical protein